MENDNSSTTPSVLTPTPIVLKPGINPGLSNKEYHSERLHLSSSNLKDLLKDPAKVYNDKILGNKPPEVEKPYMLIGSYLHTLVLEPELELQEYAMFPGWRKAGKEFEEFKAKLEPGKSIISKPQQDVGHRLAKAVRANKSASQLLEGGQAELSLASQILGVPVKIRADKINVEKGYIVDLKTTSQPTDHEIFKHTVNDYRYDLSAALYCQVAHDIFDKIFDFYFVVVSKTDLGCAVYKASSPTLSVGASDVIKALVIYKKCKETDIWDLTSLGKSAIVDSDEILEV